MGFVDHAREIASAPLIVTATEVIQMFGANSVLTTVIGREVAPSVRDAAHCYSRVPFQAPMYLRMVSSYEYINEVVGESTIPIVFNRLDGSRHLQWDSELGIPK